MYDPSAQHKRDYLKPRLAQPECEYFNAHFAPQESVTKYSSRHGKVGYKHSCYNCKLLELSKNLPYAYHT